MSKSASLLRSKAVHRRETARDFEVLDRECAVFTYHIIKQRPDNYVMDKYRQAHLAGDFLVTNKLSLWDRLLVYISSRNPILTRVVDSYTSVFCRRSLVRKKQIVLMAILETTAPTDNCFECPDSPGKSRLCVALSARLVLSMLVLCFSVVLFLPVHFVLAVQSKIFR